MKDINELDWPDVPIKSVQSILDIDKRKEYITKIKMCYSKVINPLSDIVERRSFNFSQTDDKLTCRLMVDELKEELYTQGYKEKDIVSLIGK